MDCEHLEPNQAITDFFASTAARICGAGSMAESRSDRAPPRTASSLPGL